MEAEAAAGFMARALRLAERGLYSTHPNPRVGCVIVLDGQIVGEGFHRRAGEAHAEVHALRVAGERARGAELLVTLEPCCHHGRTPPCTDAIIAAGVRKVWLAMQDPNPQVAGQGAAKLRAAGIEVETGLMQREAERLNRGFISRMIRGRPWVTLKLAASVDGRTAMASGESRWISSPESRADVHRLRAEAGAVLTSSATVLTDDPALTVRLPGDWRQPDRIVLDRRAIVPAQAKVWAEGARRYRIAAVDAAAPAGVEVVKAETGPGGQLDLPKVLPLLGARGINQVLVECGARLSGALLAGRLVDEIVLYQAPVLLGHEARPLAHMPDVHELSDRIGLKWSDVRQIGPDLRLTGLLV